MSLLISIIGCGWLGRPLASHLKNNGHKVNVTTRKTEQFSELDKEGLIPFLLTLESGNLMTGPDAEKLWAADVFIITIPPSSLESDFLEGMSQLLDKILETDLNKRIIYTSSTGVYGKAAGLTDEKSPCNPDRATAKTILKCEEIIQEKATNYTILRLAGLAGKNRKPGNFFAGKKGLSNAETPVNLVHLDDCVNIISKLIVSEVNLPILNVCADKHPLHKDFYTNEALKSGLPVPEYLDNGTNNDLKIIDNRLLKQCLSYQFLHPDPSEFPF
jgi:nucleoside-diphosphate-sugar epimerase